MKLNKYVLFFSAMDILQWIGVSITIEGTVGIIANGMVIVVLQFHPKLMGAPTKFIKQQSLIDLIVCLTIILSNENLVSCFNAFHVKYADNLISDLICKIWIQKC